MCEQVKPLVDQGEPIPPSLMAKLLKFKLLHVKQKDLDRREEERKVPLNIYIYFLTNYKNLINFTLEASNFTTG